MVNAFVLMDFTLKKRYVKTVQLPLLDVKYAVTPTHVLSVIHKRTLNLMETENVNAQQDIGSIKRHSDVNFVKPALLVVNSVIKLVSVLNALPKKEFLIKKETSVFANLIPLKTHKISVKIAIHTDNAWNAFQRHLMPVQNVIPH